MRRSALSAFDQYYARIGSRVAPADGIHRMGAKGARVRELEALLGRAGAVVKVDGDFGPTTRDAVKALQGQLGLVVDGVVGPKTMAAFASYRVAPDEKLGSLRVADLPNVGKVVSAVAGGVVLTDAKASVEGLAAHVGELAGKVAAFPALAGYAEVAASGLVTVAAVLGVAAAEYGAWQWISAGRTYEGVTA